MIVTDEAFEYLRVQKGSLDFLANNRAAWLKGYEATLMQDLADVRPFLPVGSVLDVGGGLGGVDALIVQESVLMAMESGSPLAAPVQVAILDGIKDAPLMHLHRETFSNASVAARFLHDNGVQMPVFVDPDTWQPALTAPADLVISFGAWCFHFPPAVYLRFVERSCTATAPVVVDVRKDKPEWRADLERAFGKGRVIRPMRKANRMVFARA